MLMVCEDVGYVRQVFVTDEYRVVYRNRACIDDVVNRLRRRLLAYKFYKYTTDNYDETNNEHLVIALYYNQLIKLD